MKNKSVYGFIYKMMILVWILAGMIVMTGCGKQDVSVQPTENAETSAYQVVTDIGGKYVCAMYRLEEHTDATIGKIQSLDDKSIVLTSEYTEDMGSFNFWITENGRYQVSILHDDVVLSEHFIDINEENDYYLLYMKGMR